MKYFIKQFRNDHNSFIPSDAVEAPIQRPSLHCQPVEGVEVCLGCNQSVKAS